MVEGADPLLIKLIAELGWTAKTVMGAIGLIVAWAVRWILSEIKNIKMTLSRMETDIPKTFATKPDVERALIDVWSKVDMHVKTIQTDVTRLHSGMAEVRSSMDGLKNLLIDKHQK